MAPVYPRKSDERSYYNSINAQVSALQISVAAATAVAGDSFYSWSSAINKSFNAVNQNQDFGKAEATTHMTRIKDYHTQQFFTKAKKALGVDVRPLLTEQWINRALTDRIKQNVALIKSIPDDLHPQVINVVQDVFNKQGFNQSGLRKAINDRFSVARSRAKLIARDQTSKAIGQFTQIRQQQLGISKYQWLGVDDDRERESHLENNNQIFSWDNPPETGHPGEAINCRCVALAQIDF